MSTKRNSVGLDLTEGPILRLLLVFAVPMVLASVIQQLYSAVDLIIIGQYVGNVGTVGVSTGATAADLLTMVAMALSTGAQIYISQLAGAKDTVRIKKAAGTILTLLVILMVVSVVGIVIFRNSILDVLNCPGEAREQAMSYMMITGCGILFVFGYNGVCAILRGMGESKKPLIFITIAAIINIGADWLLVAVFKLEAAGTAIATVLSQAGSFFAALYYMNKHRDQFDFELKFSYLQIDMTALRAILMMGVPQLIRSFAVQGSMIWVKAHINTYGLVVSSTYNIGNRIEQLMNVFVMGVDGAAGAMIGQNIGAKKYNRVNKTLFNALFVSLGIAAVVDVLFLGIPRPLFRLFTADAEVIEFGVVFLRIMAVGMPIVAASSAFKSISTGSGAALLSLLIGVLDGLSRIGACLLFYYVFNQGAQSYFWGAAFCMLIPGLISAGYFFSGKWKYKKLLSER